MFAFYNSDWFTITLEIIFLLLIGYDIKHYYTTRKRQYLINIILTIGFFFWAIVPFYNKYYGWQEKEKEMVVVHCLQEHNESYCDCFDDMVFKAYDLEEYKQLDHDTGEDYLEFVNDTDAECRGEGSWF